MSVKPKEQVKVDTVERVGKSTSGLHYACYGTGQDEFECNRTAEYVVNKRTYCRQCCIVYCFERGIQVPFKPRKVK